MLRALKVFTYFFAASIGAALAFYGLVQMIESQSYGMMGMRRRYHVEGDSDPLLNLALNAFIYGIIATPCALRWAGVGGWRRQALSIGIVVAAIVAVALQGAVLSTIEEMGGGTDFWSYLVASSGTGVKILWLAVELIWPYILVVVVIGHVVTLYGLKITRPLLSPQLIHADNSRTSNMISHTMDPILHRTPPGAELTEFTYLKDPVGSWSLTIAFDSPSGPMRLRFDGPYPIDEASALLTDDPSGIEVIDVSSHQLEQHKVKVRFVDDEGVQREFWAVSASLV